MKNIKKTLLLLLSLTIFSCYSMYKEKLVDVYDFDHLDKTKSSKQIDLRTDRIKELEDNIYKLENYNKKFGYKTTLEGSNSVKTESLDSTLSINKVLIFKYQTEVKKLKKEIEILNKKTE